jgi:hypothetical protein
MTHYVFCLGTYVSYIRKLMFREVIICIPLVLATADQLHSHQLHR